MVSYLAPFASGEVMVPEARTASQAVSAPGLDLLLVGSLVWLFVRSWTRRHHAHSPEQHEAPHEEVDSARAGRLRPVTYPSRAEAHALARSRPEWVERFKLRRKTAVIRRADPVDYWQDAGRENVTVHFSGVDFVPASGAKSEFDEYWTFSRSYREGKSDQPRPWFIRTTSGTVPGMKKA